MCCRSSARFNGRALHPFIKSPMRSTSAASAPRGADVGMRRAWRTCSPEPPSEVRTCWLARAGPEDVKKLLDSNATAARDPFRDGLGTAQRGRPRMFPLLSALDGLEASLGRLRVDLVPRVRVIPTSDSPPLGMDRILHVFVSG